MKRADRQSREFRILSGLETVARERQRRLGSPDLEGKVQAVKVYQQARFSLTYADLLSDTRYRPAATFFLEELYGPADFTHRDAQFARIVPRLVQMLPEMVVDTVCRLSELHALSEELDSEMGQRLEVLPVNARAYVAAWQGVGRDLDRGRQIEWILEIGRALDTFAHLPLVVTSLRLMRGPARSAGLSDLQHFLEAGFAAFNAMKGASYFLGVVSEREHRLASTLFGVLMESLPESSPCRIDAEQVLP